MACGVVSYVDPATAGIINRVDWSYAYNGDVLPTSAGPAWTVASGASGPLVSVRSDGSTFKLTSGLGSANARSYQIQDPSLWNGQRNSTLEVRLRVVTWDAGGAAGTVAQTLRIATGTRDVQLSFRPNEIFFLGGPSYPVDATQFHTYRVLIEGGAIVSLYVDGNPIPALTRTETAATTANLLRFGDITASGAGTVSWDHLRWNNNGAFPPAAADAFGTRQIYPTFDGGREWRANWSNGSPRTLSSGDRDPWDAELIMRGNGTAAIDGRGIAKIAGSAPRLYVYDEAETKRWNNVEVTFYAMRVSETAVVSSQGFVAGTRSNHQDQTSTEPNPCTHNYYGRMLYDGRIDFSKEIVHPSYGAAQGNMHVPPAPVPANTWIGYKLVVRTLRNGSVALELYRDKSNGQNGGAWQLVADYIDVGRWDTGATCPARGITSSSQALTLAGASTFIRNDGIREARYKKFSIREIHPGN